MLLTIGLALVLIVAITRYFKYSSDKDYWEKQTVAYEARKNVFGILWEFIVGDKPLHEIVDDIYQKHPDAPVIGSYYGPNLMIIPKDTLNIQHIMSTDFQNFYSRGTIVNYEKDVLADSILFNEGMKWKIYRQKLTPVFTGAKLKNMFSIMKRNGEDFVKYVDQERTNEQKAFDTITNFTAMSLVATIFSIDFENQNLQKSPLLKIARRALEPSTSQNLKLAFSLMFPRVFLKTGLAIFSEFETVFIHFVKQVLRAREKENTKRNDFINACVELQKEKILKDPTTGFQVEATDEQMAAQAFFFFIAGIEPSATVMFFTLFELAKHPDIQRKVQSEIDKVFRESEGNLTFECVEKLEYLDMVIDEAARIYPPIALIQRRCTSDTVLPVGNVKITAGTYVSIPVYSIHHDPKHYNNPEEFNPENFSAERRSNRSRYCFMPFGEGNRACIGNRFAKIQIKTGLLHVLRDFNVETSAADAQKAPRHLKYAKSSFALRSNDVNFTFIKRRK